MPNLKQQFSQTSDVGSIPIARSINLVDSVALPLLRLKNGANWPEFWTQLGPNFFPTSDFPARFFGLTSGWAPLRPVLVSIRL